MRNLNSDTCTILGVGGLVIGWYFLYCGYNARGKEMPKILRPVTWF